MTATLAMASATRVYDRLAPRYATLHRRWLRYAGGEAQAALEASVRALLKPGDRMLDAGAGTGAFARRLLGEVDALRMTLLEPSARMMAQALDLPVEHRAGVVEELPFPGASFDVVTCAWALEVSAAPERALAELARVTRPGGVLVLAFCAARPRRGITGALLRSSVEWRGQGAFLRPERVMRRLRTGGVFEVCQLPCAGPAAAVLARRVRY